MSRPRPGQFVGALIGCAVADALGAPLEGWFRERIAKLPSVTDRYRPLSRGKDAVVRYPVGQYTDDTQLTVAIARSIVARGAVDGAEIADEFAALWRSGEIVGAGPVAHRAVQRLIEGVPWQDAAMPDDLPLNGAAMRIAPVGLWNCDRPDRLADDVATASVVTHRHPVAIDAAMAVATAVAHAVTASVIETPVFLDAVAASVQNPGFAGHIQRLGDWLRSAEQTALEAIADTGQRRGDRGFGIPALAEPTVLAALYAFLRSPGDYVATIDCALRIGGDVDTIAAIAGALSGAHNGVDAIPGHLVRGVKDSAEIMDLGRRLFARRFDT
ncbi:MAG: ADP-ribosylglycohydrolase family protein [Gammaproteobacteria bacterium]|nr:ADP-ribosylglycohydrolase family protein [Gammaproteobacteria bacterium]